MRIVPRITCILLAVVLAFAVSIPVFAMEEVLQNGSIFIRDNETVCASEKSFEAYKVLDLRIYQDDRGEVVAYDYTVPSELKDFYAARYHLSKDAPDFSKAVTRAIREEENIYQFAADVIRAVSSEPYTGSPAEEGYRFTDLPLGYYVIADVTGQGDFVKPVSALMLDTVIPNVEISLKAEKPHVDKHIDADHDLSTLADRVNVNQAAIGDRITYVIESQVPDMTGYEKYFFILRDYMSTGLSYNGDMTLTLGDKTLKEGEDYLLTVTEYDDGTTGLKVVFCNFLQYNTEELLHAPIVLSYTATLNRNAELADRPNTNRVYLEYSNDPIVEYEGEHEPTEEDQEKTPLGVTPNEWVETYTTALKLIKTDPLGNRLEGAVFTLSGKTLNMVRVARDEYLSDPKGDYWKLTDGSFTLIGPEDLIDGAPVDKSKYDSLTEKYSRVTSVVYEQTEGEDRSVKGTVGHDGIVSFEGLGVGTYVLKELYAPDGYNILTEELEISIQWDEKNHCFTYTTAVEDNGIGRVIVVNIPGTSSVPLLPNTGGIGTILFYTTGSVLVLFALILLISKKRMAGIE